ncbi:Cytochrome P450 83B1 [Linum perenne]
MSPFLVYFLLVIPTILLFLLFLNKHKKTSNVCLPPGPKGLPLIGNLFQIDPSAPHRYLWKLSQIHGPLMTLKQGRVSIIVVSSAKMAREIMKTHDLIFSNRQSITGQQKLSYNGQDVAFAPYDSYWREMKKICIVHLFNSHRVKSFHSIREFEVSKMVEKISKGSCRGTPFNLSEAMMYLTSIIICRVAFGKRYEEEGIERSGVLSHLKETQALFTSFYFSDYFPLLGFIDKLSGLRNRLDKNFKEWDAFYQDMIDEHLHPNRAKPDEDDILDVLLRILKDKSSKVQLTLNHIKAILMNIFIGGTDTSAATVVWAMTYLMKNPKMMIKAQEEVRHAIGKKGLVNEEDIQQLSYLKAIVKETLRLQPTLPLMVPRESTQSCNLGGYEIPAKTVVSVNAWAIGRDTQAWGENPEEFKPERFIGKSIDVKGSDFELIPFGAGRRICPGIHMGLSTVELSLANLLYAFDWEMPTGMSSEDLDMEVLPGITMHKKNPLCLVASIRSYI